MVWSQTEKNVFIRYRYPLRKSRGYPDSKVHGANMGPTWVLSAPDGPHVGPMNIAIRLGLWHMAIQNTYEKKGIGKKINCCAVR